jgi:hypothetical protein
MEQHNTVKSPVKKMDEVNCSDLFEAKDDGLEMICKILMRIKKYLGNDWKKSRILYRGVSKDYTSEHNKKKYYSLIRSGAAVRLDPDQKMEYTHSDYMAYIRGLITDVKRNYPENYADWYDLEILGDLQHNGAGTCLVDFSRNVLISLWFACGNMRGEEDGKLYCYDINDDLIKRNSLKIIKETDLGKPIEKLLVETKHITNYCSNTEYSFFMWTPSNLNNRIARQDSVFVFGLPPFSIKDHSILEITIPHNYKIKIREALEFYFDVNDASIFNDRHGFATVNDKLTPYPRREGCYEQGLDEMFKGNYKTALDYFIMEENSFAIIKKVISPDSFIKIAEIHLSKAICYKYINENDNEEKDKYANNAIREYSKAQYNYEKALESAKNYDEEWKRLYARKLLRTLNDEIHLHFVKKDYKRCIDSCDKAIKSIEKLREMEICDNKRIDNTPRYFKDVYCKLSKLELLLLIVFQEGEDIDETKRDQWNTFLKDANNRKDEMSGFDSMLLQYFENVWDGIINYGRNAKKEFDISSLEEKIEKDFICDIKDSVPYSSWDFTEIKDAISQTKMLNDSAKVSLTELTALMISIRDKYNVKELNTPEGNYHQFNLRD